MDQTTTSRPVAGASAATAAARMLRSTAVGEPGTGHKVVPV